MSSLLVPIQVVASEQVSTFPKKTPELKSRPPILSPKLPSLVIPAEDASVSLKPIIETFEAKTRSKEAITTTAVTGQYLETTITKKEMSSS
jgi:hypothetical protein